MPAPSVRRRAPAAPRRPRAGRAPAPAATWTTPVRSRRALEQAEEALAPRVDDARLAQDRQERRGLRRRPSRRRRRSRRGPPPGRRRARRSRPPRRPTRGSPSGSCPRPAWRPRRRPPSPPRRGHWRGPAPLNRVLPASPSAMPRRIWLVITPELPRAPMSAPKLRPRATARPARRPERLGLGQRGPHGGDHVRAGVAVGDRVHVQGVDLVDVRLEVGDGGAEGAEQPRSRRRPGAPSGDVRRRSRRVVATSSAVGQVDGPGRWRWRGGSPPGLELEAVDVDRQPVDLPPERRRMA